MTSGGRDSGMSIGLEGDMSSLSFRKSWKTSVAQVAQAWQLHRDKAVAMSYQALCVLDMNLDFTVRVVGLPLSSDMTCRRPTTLTVKSRLPWNLHPSVLLG